MKKMKFTWILFVSATFLILQSCATEEFESEVLEKDLEIEDTDDKRPEVSRSNSNLIIEWSDMLLELDRQATGMRPNATARALAYIHLATYETVVVNMNGYTSNSARLDGLTINRAPRNIDPLIALNACYARVLDHFIYNVPENSSRAIRGLEVRKERELSSRLSRRLVQDSKRWGQYIASTIIDYSKTDIAAEEQILAPQPTSYEPPVGAGFWTYSAAQERALFPYWSEVRTFVISPEETTSVPPVDQYSAAPESGYYQQMLEVYDVSTKAAAENNDDLWIAEFWSDDVEGLMMSPPGRQISIASQIIDEYNLDLQESLVLLLKLGFSLNDAAVSTWDDKYKYMVMRPNVYIQEYINADYQTNLFKFIYWPNPSFPGYPSGHSSFASAAAGLFIDLVGDATDFTDNSHKGTTEFLGTPRQFASFSEMAEENAFSRIPLGVHIRMDCTEGLRLGYEISNAVNALNLSDNNSL
ncbi:hypothetical protein GCM10022393_00840 [Aquimarina addita]|uniref:Phosphatidic acid phosphatase type 2/haloperoxidase domain-containing protein n=1 Tax=Aquimarina addita TaxID=870485 RepID=A0ABP7X7B2_9FLAO